MKALIALSIYTIFSICMHIDVRYLNVIFIEDMPLIEWTASLLLMNMLLGITFTAFHAFQLYVSKKMKQNPWLIFIGKNTIEIDFPLTHVALVDAPVTIHGEFSDDCNTIAKTSEFKKSFEEAYSQAAAKKISPFTPILLINKEDELTDTENMFLNNMMYEYGFRDQYYIAKEKELTSLKTIKSIIKNMDNTMFGAMFSPKNA